jgi:hypothetical protein
LAPAGVAVEVGVGVEVVVGVGVGVEVEVGVDDSVGPTALDAAEPGAPVGCARAICTHATVKAAAALGIFAIQEVERFMPYPSGRGTGSRRHPRGCTR